MHQPTQHELYLLLLESGKEIAKVWKRYAVGTREVQRELFTMRETRWAKNEVPAPESFLLGNCYHLEPLRWGSPRAAALPPPSLRSAAPAASPAAVTPARVTASFMAGAGHALRLLTRQHQLLPCLHVYLMLIPGHRDPFPHGDNSPENLSCCSELPLKPLVT